MTTLESYLSAGDKRAEICRAYDDFAEILHQQYLRTLAECANGAKDFHDTDETNYLRKRSLLARFDALYELFTSFHRTNYDQEIFIEKWRPEWPVFSEKDFLRLCGCVFYLLYDHVFELEARIPNPSRPDPNHWSRYDLFFNKRFDATGKKLLVRPEMGPGMVGLTNLCQFVTRTNTYNARGLIICLHPPGEQYEAFVAGVNQMAGLPLLGIVAPDTWKALLVQCATIRAAWAGLLGENGSEDFDCALALNDRWKAQQQARDIVEGCFLS